MGTENNTEKTGFFEQYALCVQPFQYRRLLKVRMAKKVWYFILLFLVLVFVEAGMTFIAWDASVGGLKGFFTNRIPSFTLENGTLSMESPIEINLESAVRIKVDSSKTSFKKEDLDDDYIMETLVGSKKVLYKNHGRIVEMKISDFGTGDMNNQTLVHAIPLVRASIAGYAVALALAKAVKYIVLALFFALLCRSTVKNKDGEMVTYGQAYTCAMYAQTLPALIVSVNVALGYLVSGFGVSLATMFLMMFLIVRAEVGLLTFEER
ncbi:MAG: DUF1189 family protein [Lachnospiraceae bacterium]|nr:DUF1189 family protein [Lachnospiraceae bacterium]